MIPLCSPNQANLPTALALGSFDGLHSGHRKVISEITKEGPGIPTLVSFWPHPREVLYGESRLRLDLPFEKTFLLEPLGVKQLVLVPFNSSLAGLSAQEFFDKILVKELQACRIAVGANFHFGKNREGDTSLLKEFCDSQKIKLSIVPILEDNEGRVSSSRIRAALSRGNLKMTKELLGRSYKFSGVVITGRGLGKTIGWPTANLKIDDRKLLPALGVYAVWAQLPGFKQPLPGVMNLGPQPTIDKTSVSSAEIHLLDQSIDLIGKELLIEPIQKIRDQKKFKNLETLSQQIGRDADLARSILNKL